MKTLSPPPHLSVPETALGIATFMREVDVGFEVRTSALRNGGGPTTVLRVFTDEAGNLITAYPF